MLRNYIKIVWRDLKRNPVFSSINILGLSTGLASAFLIYFWVSAELKVDKFHANDNRLYKVMEKSTENGTIVIHDGTQGPLSDALEKDLPEVERGITVMNLEKRGMSITFKSEENVYKSSGLFASKAFFDVFSFPLIYGAPSQVLLDKNAIAVSESFANKLFGSAQNALDKQVEYSFFGKKQLATVTGVFKDAPKNSTLKFDYVATKQKLLEDIWPGGQKWTNEGPDTYVLLRPNVDVPAFNDKIEDFIDKYNQNNSFSLFTRKYSDIYLRGNYEEGVQNGGRITYVRLFSFVAILVLLIACINFMNLSTARVSRRFKEIGIKKTVGGTKTTLIVQFLTESLLLTFFSLALAILLVLALIPVFNFITGKELDLYFTFNDMAIIFLVSCLTGLISGSYPAFYLSGFNPLSALKGNFQSKGVELFARKGLVVFQFMASLVMVISVLIISKQINYALSKPIGYQKENLIHFDLEGKAFENPELLFKELSKIDGVESVGGLSESIVSEDGGSSTYGFDWPGNTENKNIDFMLRGIDENFIGTMGIKMATGQAFLDDMGAPESYLILNEEAVKLMGLKDPLGAKVRFWGEEKTILGIVKDFHTASVIQKIRPLIFRYAPKNLEMAMVRIEAGKERMAIEKIKRFYTDYNPGFNFNFSFQDQTLEAQYLSQQQILRLARYFAYLAIFISCLGLFGLAAFSTELRTKEIGIRKVLGSSSLQILKLLSSDFMKLVGLAFLIASPIAWFAMDYWLENFAFRIPIQGWMFVIAGTATALIALLTVGFHALRASLANPVKSLRTE